MLADTNPGGRVGSPRNLDRDRFVEHYRRMWRIRAFEQAAAMVIP